MSEVLTTRDARLILAESYMNQMQDLADIDRWKTSINWCDREMVMHSHKISKSLLETAKNVYSDLRCRPYSETVEEMMVETIRILLKCSVDNFNVIDK